MRYYDNNQFTRFLLLLYCHFRYLSQESTILICAFKKYPHLHNFLVAVFLLQFSSVAQSCPTLCDPMNCSTPGLPVHHQLPESTQTHVYRVGDAIQPTYPLSSPSPPALNLSKHPFPFPGDFPNSGLELGSPFKLQSVK